MRRCECSLSIASDLPQVDDATYLNLAALLGGALTSFSSPQSHLHYLGDCACSWEEGIALCERFEYFDCSVFSPRKTSVPEVMGHYACGGAGYLLSYAAVQEFVRFEQVRIIISLQRFLERLTPSLRVHHHSLLQATKTLGRGAELCSTLLGKCPPGGARPVTRKNTCCQCFWLAASDCGR